MGLLTILKKTKRKEKSLRVLVLGLDNAGKTTVVKCLRGEVDVERASPTVGFDIHSLEYMGFTLNIWDVGGQESIRAYWRNYFEQTDGLIWVVDSADTERMGICRSELRILLQEERLAGAALLVLANKQDLSGAMSAPQLAQALDLEHIEVGYTPVHDYRQ